MERASMEYRRRRVKIIKKVIIGIIIFCLLMPTVLSLILMVKVASLQSRVEELSQERAAGQSVSANANVDENADTPLSGGPSLTDAPTSSAVEGNDANVSSDTTASSDPAASSDTTVSSDPAASSKSAASDNGSAATPGAVTGEGTNKVYLTFDDGPGTQTEKILDILKKENVKATFFVTGKDDSYSRKIYKRIVDEGHTLGLHSYSHIYENIYASASAFRKDTKKEYDLIYEITGQYPKFYRFPGGSGSEKMEVPLQELTAVLDEFQLQYIDWNIISMDAVNPGADKEDIARGIVEAAQQYASSVVLMYDTADKPKTVKALPLLIRQLKEKNYELLAIDENTALIRHNQ